MLRRILFTTFALAIALAGATTAGAAEKLTADDYAEIQQLYVKYARAIDSGDAMAWAKTFTDDGVFGDSAGHDALVAFAKGFHENFQGHARHWNDEILITATEEGADGSCYLTLYNTGTAPPTVVVTAIYNDKLVRTADGWRFKMRAVTPDPRAESGQ
jgi:bifunctional aromatase (cyclase/dehydratase)